MPKRDETVWVLADQEPVRSCAECGRLRARIAVLEAFVAADDMLVAFDNGPSRSENTVERIRLNTVKKQARAAVGEVKP